MMWPVRPRTPSPRVGAKRTRRRFAVIPRRVDEDDPQPMWLWLGWYYEYQEYGDRGYSFGWITVTRYSVTPL